ncbi:hypothetical protein R6Q59_001694 [Mikania micrantha]
MTYAGLHMFMEKLKQLINCNDNPFINHPEIIREKHQFHLLHQDLASIIQILYIDQHQDPHQLEKFYDLKKRFIDAAEEAQYIVDLFLSAVHTKYNGNLSPTSEEEDITPSLNLVDVRRSFDSVRVEFMSTIINKMELNSSLRPERTLNQSAAAAPRNSPGSKKLPDDMIIVGIDDDAKLIKDKLMGIEGSWILSLLLYHFHVRVWVTVSQTYNKRDVLIQILESICGQLDLGVASDSRLRELVHKQLKGKRYLIVVDDIWHIETWDNLKLIFPNDNNRSRILLTSRVTDVAKHATSDGLIHHLGYLNKEKGWELLCKKVFQGNDCPEWSIKHGMQIVENCKGLPLAVAVISGVLATKSLSEKFWVEIAYRTCSYIVGEQNEPVMESLALSYNHLPLHLRDCFLYLGGFPEDYRFKVQWLILLWVAEGFIQEDGNRSLEDIAEGYLMDLIDRNLVNVEVRSNSNGGVKACKVHDLVMELCLRKGKEEGFIIKTKKQTSSSLFSNVTTLSYTPVRMFIDKNLNIRGFPHMSAQNLRSILCFNGFRSLSDDIAKCFRSFMLLRVLDLHKCILKDFPKGIELLVHLRYLAIWKSTKGFPSSICNLWGLQTLIYITNEFVALPSNISDLVNLRHLLSYHPLGKFSMGFILPYIEKPMNLQSFSRVKLGDGVDFQTCFPNIKELGCLSDKKNDFKSFSCLEKLKLIGRVREHITLPTTLKTLQLTQCGFPWSEMSIIQSSLPNLQVLKLQFKAIIQSCVSKASVGESVRRIQDDQHDIGNYDLMIDVIDGI